MSEARVDFQDKAEAPERVREIYEAIEAKFGILPNIIKTLGNSPAGLETVSEILGMTEDFQLDPKYSELAYLKATEVNECHY